MYATVALMERPAQRIAAETRPTAPETSSILERAGSATARRLAPREHVFCEGDRRTHVFQVEQGALVLYKVLPDGRRQVMGFAYPGDFLGLGATSEHNLNAQAACPARVRCIPAAALEDAAAHDPALALKLYKALAQELSATRALLVSIGQQNALERLASFLMMLVNKLDDGQDTATPVLHLPMRRSDIADFLGLTIETVSRTFTKLRTMGLIEIKHSTEVAVTNVQKLDDIANG